MIVITDENGTKVINEKRFFNYIRTLILLVHEITKGNIINMLRGKVRITAKENNGHLDIYKEYK